MKPRIGILLSGRGSNIEAIADAVSGGEIDAEIGLVLSNRPKAPGLEKAQQRGLPHLCIPSSGLQREEFDRQVVAALKDAGVELVCLAGFMRLLSSYFVEQFPERVLNIHPSLLPSFGGLEAQHQALEYGVKFTGCTVHFVDQYMDSGPIITQAVAPVLDDDTEETLSARVLELEHKIYPEAVRLVLSGKYRIEGRRVLRT